MQDMRDLYKAYAAVHDTTIKEELDNSKDQITEMNLGQMTEGDLVEVAEEIIEGLFQYGLDLDEAYDVVGAILEEASDNVIGGRKEKIVRIAEAFEQAFDTVTDKAERNCEEAFLQYRKTKPLTEKWNNKVSHETGNAKIHASIIHEDREGVKSGLIEMISEKLDKVGEEDADIDNDGDVDSSDKYLKKRRASIGKAMKKEEVEITEGSRKPGESAKDYADRMTKKYFGKKSKTYDPMKDPDFDHDKAERTRGSMDEAMRPGERQRKMAAKMHDPYIRGGSKSRTQAHNIAVRGDVSTGDPAIKSRGGGGVKKDKGMGYGDRGAGNKARRRAGQEPLRGDTRKEELELKGFSEVEIQRILEVVESWED